MSGMGNTNTSNSEFSVLVKDARRDGVTLEYTIKPPSGPMMPGMPKGPTEPIVKTISLDAHGLARGGPESQAAWAQMTMAPLATIQLPAKPVAVGDPWEAKIPSATLFGNRAKSAGANVPTEIVVRYKLISAGKFGGKDSLKVQSTMTMDISGKEAAGESSSPLAGAKSKMDSSTVFWIDPATGQVLDSQTTMKSDTVLPGAAKAGNEGTASTIHMVIKNHTKRVK